MSRGWLMIAREEFLAKSHPAPVYSCPITDSTSAIVVNFFCVLDSLINNMIEAIIDAKITPIIAQSVFLYDIRLDCDVLIADDGECVVLTRYGIDDYSAFKFVVELRSAFIDHIKEEGRRYLKNGHCEYESFSNLKRVMSDSLLAQLGHYFIMREDALGIQK